VLFLLFGGGAALRWSRREAASFFMLRGAHYNRHHPSLSEEGRRCVTCVTRTPKTASDLPKQR
jgi:hypothetical protein